MLMVSTCNLGRVALMRDPAAFSRGIGSATVLFRALMPLVLRGDYMVMMLANCLDMAQIEYARIKYNPAVHVGSYLPDFQLGVLGLIAAALIGSAVFYHARS